MAKKEKNDTRYKISKELYKKWQQIFYKEETRDYAVKYALTYIKKSTCKPTPPRRRPRLFI